jgi:hypothetical protein
MKTLKYIRRINEALSEVKIISVSDHTVKLINPNGKEVTIEVEEDGSYEDWVDPPYVKEVSVRGEDDTYQYGMTAQTDEHGSHFEIMTEYDIDVKTLVEVRQEEEARRIKNQEWKDAMNLKAQKDADALNIEIESSGLSKEDYIQESALRMMLGSPDNIRKQEGIDPNEDYSIAHVVYYSYDSEDGKVSDADNKYYKVPSIDMGDDMKDLMGIDSDPEQLLIDKGAIGSNSAWNFVKLIDKSRLPDPKKYIERAPYFVNIERFIDYAT